MASITKVKNNKGMLYKVIYELPKGLDGKRRKTSKTFPPGTALSEVKEFAAEKELERSRGSSLGANFNLTFAELGEIYFSTYTINLSPSTLKGYKSAFYNSKRYGLKNYFGKAKLRNIKQRDIQNYTNFLCKFVTPKSTKNYLALLNIIFNLAVQEAVIQREANPMLYKIIKPKQLHKEVEAYNLEEFKLLLRLSESDGNPNIQLFVAIALLAGLRRGELAALKWEDVDFEKGFLIINKSKIVIDKKEYIKAPKTNSGNRKIYVPELLLKILKKYRERYIINKLKYGRNFNDSGYVAAQENGTPFSPQGISNCYVRFMKRHSGEIRYLKFHGLRHSYASLLIENGENPKTVQHNLGHSDVSLTLQIYSHSYESAQKNAADKLNETVSLNTKIG